MSQSAGSGIFPEPGGLAGAVARAHHDRHGRSSRKTLVEADLKLSAPAARRNREPIAAVLADWLPRQGLALEVASGSGEHAAFFAQLFPGLEWQPTDPDPSALNSIEAWRADSGLANLREPVVLDA